jgi:hypothetical protein
MMALALVTSCRESKQVERGNDLVPPRRPNVEVASRAAESVAPDATDSSTAPADSVLLQRELDGTAGTDRLVSEFHRTGAPGPVFMERRAALYLGSARSPAWSSGWDDMSIPRLTEMHPLPGGGSLLKIDVESGDGGEMLIVLARHDSARVVLRQGGDYDDWDLRVRKADGRIIADVAGFMVRNDSSTTPSIRCPDTGMPGWTFTFDDKAGEFARQREICVPRRQ